tara:strand:- start:372 stop:1838 length:1467 start_codon:yes stop_codon:yes gene_type:complete
MANRKKSRTRRKKASQRVDQLPNGVPFYDFTDDGLLGPKEGSGSVALSPEDPVEMGGLRSQIVYNWQKPFLRHKGYRIDPRRDQRKSISKQFLAYAKQLGSPSTVHYKISNEALDIIIPTIKRSNRRVFVNNYWNARPPHKSMFVEWDAQYLENKLQNHGLTLPEARLEQEQPESEIHGVWIQERRKQYGTAKHQKPILLPPSYSYSWFGQIGSMLKPEHAYMLNNQKHKDMAMRGEKIYETRQAGITINSIAYHEEEQFLNIVDRFYGGDKERAAHEFGVPFLLHYGMNRMKEYTDGLSEEDEKWPVFTPDEKEMFLTLTMGSENALDPTAPMPADIPFHEPVEDHDLKYSGMRETHAQGFFTVIINIISLLNQPWVQVEDGVIGRGTKSVAENINRGEIHKVVKLTVPFDKAVKLFQKTKARTRKFGTAQHTVRGHWRTYKKTGETVWVGEHIRGDAKYGIVHKDYEVVKRSGYLKTEKVKKNSKK